MTRRFRMIAGPNDSGKSTLTEGLAHDYAVNFYTRLNADVLFAELKRTLATQAPFPLEGDALKVYAVGSEYAETEKAHFSSTTPARCVSWRAVGRGGFVLQTGADLPNWFRKYVYDPLKTEGEGV